MVIINTFYDIAYTTDGNFIGWYGMFKDIMMTSSNGNIFRVTGPLCGEFTGHQ